MREPEGKLSLDALDPSTDDPAYWARFQRTVVARARPIMAERRHRSQVTLEGVLFRWGRLIVPVAAVAAAVAALVLSRGEPAEPARVAGVEEILEGPTGVETLPSFLHGDEVGRDLVLLAVELR